MLKLKPALQQSEGRSKPWAGAKLVNAFAEKADGDKVDDFAIMAIPGLTEYLELSTEETRGTHFMGGLLYVIMGAVLYIIDSAGTVTSPGGIGGTGPVRIVDNGTQIAFAPSDQIGYIYDSGTGILTASPPNLPSITDVAYIDGYFVWPVANSDQFIISALGDGLTYDPLDVATVEGDPDALVGVINDHRELHFPGGKSWEIWYNSGGADFPFSRQGNAFIERGCIDKDSLVKIDNSLHFVGDDRIVYRLEGYSPTRISTHAIEYRIASATYFRAFTYTQEGHKFYGLNTDVGSFFYDMATGAWAERISFGRDNYRAANSVVAWGQILFGDAELGRLYTPSLDVHTEDGNTIPVIIELPPITANRERSTLYAFELYCETGVGTALAPDPQVIMQYSKDGGRTWSLEMWRSLGAVGEYLTRAVWRPNVQFRQLQIRISMPDSTRRLVMGYYADIR